MAAASQFKDNAEVKRIPYVKSLEDVEDLMKTIEDCEACMIVSTIITVNVREYLTQKCIEKKYKYNKCIRSNNKCSFTILNKYPDYNPGAMWNTDETYYKRIEASGICYAV
ncbi:kinase/pyrophosphorylase [Clostridium perfringens]|uniref:kinase/pyrophosphorylase n=1 Tax=Clostridium perfringens TaxID=1502 RepID=UPI00242CA4D5|nr:kinase/pyrophosphorylase [Clostridium perfringens]